MEQEYNDQWIDMVENVFTKAEREFHEATGM